MKKYHSSSNDKVSPGVTGVTENAFVKCYDVDSPEGQEIIKNMKGVGGSFPPGAYKQVIVCKDPYQVGKWQKETFDMGEKVRRET